MKEKGKDERGRFCRKRPAAAAMAAAAGIILLTAGCGSRVMDRDQAFRLALADAGLSQEEVTLTSQRLDEDDGKSYYQIAFTSESYAYRYEIDASSGAVTQMSIDAVTGQGQTGQSQAAGDSQSDGAVRPGQPGGGQSDEPGQSGQPDGGQSGESGQSGQPGGGQSDESGQSGQPDGNRSNGAGQGTSAAGGPGQGAPGQPGGQPGNQAKTIDSVKLIALADAGLTQADVTFTKEKLDWDDGIPVYDIDFYTAEMEYEYEIDAFTGAIIEREAERFVNPGAGGYSGTENLIGEDRAKETAVTHAGFGVEDVFFTKVELEMEDGILEYEIEFYQDRVEYDYTIDAATGTILEYDSEYGG